MTISYELAKELKDAGFDQREHLIAGQADRNGRGLLYAPHLVMDEPDLVEALGSENCKKRAAFCYTLSYLESEEGKALTVYMPTLDELVEECEKELKGLHQIFEGEHAGEWMAQGWVQASFGENAKIAVANLYLSLHPKKLC